MSFNFLINLETTVDGNVSVTWTVMEGKISILYYFNDENIDLENLRFKKVNNYLAVVKLRQYVMLGFKSERTVLLFDLDQIMKDNKLTEEQKVAEFLKLRLFHEKTLLVLVDILDFLF